MTKRPKVVVVGSLNFDYVATVRHLPCTGETVSANALAHRFGGKGANQAVAAARLGARVSLIGCVGGDEVGRAYRKRLRSEGINTTALGTSPFAPTGLALIAVDAAGENSIVVCAGANGDLGPATVRRHGALIASANTLLLQWEVPQNSILESIRIANGAGVPVVMNPSPFRGGFPWGRYEIEVLIVNGSEAQSILDLTSAPLHRQLNELRIRLGRKRCRWLIVTRGPRPTMVVSSREYFKVPTLPVNPVDTVGAGDTFAGALATRLAEGATMSEAVRFANCAGALATLKMGAQEAIPSRAKVQRIMSSSKGRKNSALKRTL